MRLLTLALRFLLFLFFFIFALKNAEDVPLNFFFGQVWRTPLSLLLLGFFAAGVLLTVLTFLGSRLRTRREVVRLRRENARLTLLAARPVTAVLADEGANAAFDKAAEPLSQ